MDKSKLQNRSEIKYNYKHTRQPMGIYQIKNNQNGKCMVGSSPNLEGAFNREKFILNIGSHRNKELQKDWNIYGEDSFSFEVLEYLKVDEDKNRDYRDKLEEMELQWLEKLQPYGEKGYNKG